MTSYEISPEGDLFPLPFLTHELPKMHVWLQAYVMSFEGMLLFGYRIAKIYTDILYSTCSNIDYVQERHWSKAEHLNRDLSYSISLTHKESINI